MVTVAVARAVAGEWVRENAPSISGFEGAYCAGSAVWLPESAELPATSDLDLNVVVAGDVPTGRRKLRYRNVLLEVTTLPAGALAGPEMVLADYHLAGAFRRPRILADSSGRLTPLAEEVSRQFAQPEWVRRRIGHVTHRVREGLDALDPGAPLHHAVIGWIFPAGVMAHVPLVAGTSNPTVRRRYEEARELLARYGMPEVHERLLGVLGSGRWTRDQAERHHVALVPAFEDASARIRSPFPFASDISALGRPAALQGTAESIERGLHREAAFWLTVTFSRCMAVLAADAPDLHVRHEPAYRALLADLDIASPGDLATRREAAMAALPEIEAAGEQILVANPEIQVGS